MFWENIVNNDSCNILKDKVSSQSLCPHPVPNEFLVFIKVEDDVKVETDTLYDINWRAYARNLKTGEIIQFDKDKGIKVDPSAVIKMYDLSKKSVEVIDSNKDYTDWFYSHPKIYNNLISWSESKCSSDWSEKGSTYIYNIDKKEKQLVITTGTDILWPYIYGNFIAARVKPNGQNTDSSIVLYDLNKKDGWHTVVSPKSYDYKDEKYVEMLMPSINGSYLIWQDNIRSKILVYNYKSNKMYNLAHKVSNDYTVSCIGIYNNVLFWYEADNKNSVHKYAVLK